MQNQASHNTTGVQYTGREGVLNGDRMNNGQDVFTLELTGSTASQQVKNDLAAMSVKRTATDAAMDDSDSDTGSVENSVSLPQSGPKPGKKTKGRVKIKMEFIENKLRRYTTFSKRKTGIMKKAYELSTLTGTQVMLLVASETGHVYTFATRKLQPMITSESGKALIQTCLNSPDPPPVGPGQHNDQRMNPTGYEEVELSYAVAEEENKVTEWQQGDSPSAPRPQPLSASLYVNTASSSSNPHSLSDNASPSPITITTSAPAQVINNNNNNNQPSVQPTATQAQTIMTYLSSTANTNGNSNSSNSKAANISMQLPAGAITAILPQQALQAGTPITIGHLQQTQQPLAQQTQQTLYRIPQTGQVVSIPGLTSQQAASLAESAQTVSGNATATSQQNVTVVSAATGTSSSGQQGTVMYQTPQGVVYAASAAPQSVSVLPEGYILNLPHTPSATLGQDQHTGGTQQYITIPVPVSLSGSTQVLQPVLAQASAEAQLVATTDKTK